MSKKLSHTDKNGKANMVDVGSKTDQYRVARAVGKIRVQPSTIELINDNQIKKGDVLTVAEIAGIQAAKQTSGLIPLCHPLLINKIEVKTRIMENEIICESMISCIGKTGVEMEALTAVSLALLTIYDMCKAVDNNMKIEEIYLVEKTKSDI
jgi:cyclic pyranopterin monophosphate synthase